jgi:hypothetical protein
MRPVMILAALAALALAPPSFAQKVDKNGRCHDASGKFAKDEVCAGVKGSTAPASTAAAPAASAKAAKPAAAADANGPYKLDSKGKCHDAKGKMASKSKCA